MKYTKGGKGKTKKSTYIFSINICFTKSNKIVTGSTKILQAFKSYKMLQAWKSFANVCSTSLLQVCYNLSSIKVNFRLYCILNKFE